MNFQPPQSVKEAHLQVLRSAITGAVFVSEYHKNMRIKVEGESVEHLRERLQETLDSALSKEEIGYEKYEDELGKLTRIAGKHWNPALGLPESNIAQSIIRLNMVGWQLDNEDPPVLPVVPDVGARAKQLKTQMLDAQVDTLTPYQRMVFNADMKATGAAVEKAEELHESLTGATRTNSTPEEAAIPRKLPKLNIEFVDQTSLQAWVRSLANLWVLPDDREQLNRIINEADQHQRVEESTVEALTNLWTEEFPWIPKQWAEDASRAVIGSVVSTRLESVDKSSADTVRAIFGDNYQYQESRRKPKQATTEAQRSELNKALDELSDILESVKRGAEITPEINQKVTQTSDTIRLIQAQIETDNQTPAQDNEKAGPGL